MTRNKIFDPNHEWVEAGPDGLPTPEAFAACAETAAAPYPTAASAGNWRREMTTLMRYARDVLRGPDAETAFGYYVSAAVVAVVASAVIMFAAR